MMRQGMMGGMQDGGGQGGMGMEPRRNDGHDAWRRKMRKHRNLLARLDLLEARITKIETWNGS